MSLPSIMNHRFSQIPQNQLQRSSFDRSYGHKTTFDAGWLIPVFLQEILPGDTISMDASFFGRVATLLNPVMDNVFVDSFWFFCPNRLLWDNWQRFNGERHPNPNSSIDLEIPYLQGVGATNYTVAAFDIANYMGIPAGSVINPANTRISALPSRMYGLVYNEWFRDQNLQNSLTVSTGDGPDTYDAISRRRRGKRHDYFTSCLPWPQKGDSVSLPLGTTAPVIGDGTALGMVNQDPLVAGDRRFAFQTNGTNNTPAWATGAYGLLVGAAAGNGVPATATVAGVSEDPDNSGLIADLSLATAATINQLREAFAVQQLLEMDARGGTRYVEQIRSMWGVQVEDYRLQRPEYLGGSSERLNIRQVPQTSASNGSDTPQANLAAFGDIATRSGFQKSFVEHGHVMCILNVRTDITYQQGIDRHWTRSTRYDFYQPPLAHLGEQPVYLREIFYDPTDEADPTVFGYQERWAEYRYGRSYVSGAFESSFGQSLDSWHFALDFPSAPGLDSDFIVDDPPIDRARAIQPVEPDNQQIIMDCYFSFRHARLMPVYSVPGLQRL